MTNSVWSEFNERPKFESLNGDIKTDVLIVGGGITGLLCAYRLKNAGVDCVLIEADKICSGITKNTTAKITLQHGLIYDKLIKTLGKEAAELYYKANNEALKEYIKLSKIIDCDLQEKTSFVYSATKLKEIEMEERALNEICCPALLTEKTNLPFNNILAVGIENQAQFHPLKFCFAIAKNLPIFENTKALEFGKNHVLTNKGSVYFKKIIVATHFPIINKHGFYFAKLYQHRSYVLALENAPKINAMYVDEDLKGLSFRSYNNLLLLGGGSHRTGKVGGGWRELEKIAQENFKGAKVINYWATQDCMSLDELPYIGQYSKNTPNMFTATGFNKWGMTTAMVAAMVLCDLVQEKENEFAGLFSPSRSILKPQLAVNLRESLMGVLTPKTPRCPHLGCALKYNRFEHSWDCACHGSRFTKYGKLIDNPATDDIKS